MIHHNIKVKKKNKKKERKKESTQVKRIKSLNMSNRDLKFKYVVVQLGIKLIISINREIRISLSSSTKKANKPSLAVIFSF